MAVSVIGAVMFAAAAVGATVAVGRVTDSVIIPAFSGGVKSSTLWAGVALIFVVGVVRGLSVVVRRYFAAMLEARMQATLRRGVVDKYLSAPLSFHHSRPTGELSPTPTRTSPAPRCSSNRCRSASACSPWCSSP